MYELKWKERKSQGFPAMLSIFNYLLPHKLSESRTWPLWRTLWATTTSEWRKQSIIAAEVLHTICMRRGTHTNRNHKYFIHKNSLKHQIHLFMEQTTPTHVHMQHNVKGNASHRSRCRMKMQTRRKLRRLTSLETLLPDETMFGQEEYVLLLLLWCHSHVLRTIIWGWMEAQREQYATFGNPVKQIHAYY